MSASPTTDGRISDQRLADIIDNHGVYVMPDKGGRAQHRDVESALRELQRLRLSGEPTLPRNVTRYKIQQDKGVYCLKGCPDGDLVDYSAYAALLRLSPEPPEELCGWIDPKDGALIALPYRESGGSAMPGVPVPPSWIPVYRRPATKVEPS